MKSKDWKDFKVHQQLIYPSEDYGVLKCEVTEVDVKIVVELPTFHYDRPYGLTKDTGIIRIKYTYNDVIQEVTENLSNLVAYTETAFRELLKAYNLWQAYLNTANSYKQEFLQLLTTKQEE